MISFLTQDGYSVLVDDEDEDLLLIAWKIKFRENGPSYVRNSHGFLHRLILERKLGRSLNGGEVVDHANGDGLDNRRSNLRVATQSQNMQNANKKGGKHGYKGINDCRGNRYTASIRVDGKPTGLGAYPTPLDAHKAYCIAALKYHGEFAHFGSNSPFTKEELAGVEMTPMERYERQQPAKARIKPFATRKRVSKPVLLPPPAPVAPVPIEAIYGCLIIAVQRGYKFPTPAPAEHDNRDAA